MAASRRVRWTQVCLNAFFKSRHLTYQPLALDGELGPHTRRNIRHARFFLGLGRSLEAQPDDITDELIETLKSPRRRLKGWKAARNLRRLHVAGVRQRGRKRDVKAAKRHRVDGGAKALHVARLSAQADSAGRRRSFYSQAGAWTVRYAVKGEPWGYRSDCSQWFTSCYYAAGLPDPNGQGYTGGYTGTLGAHGTEISREQAMHTPGAAVLFGPYPHHHVDMAKGDGTTGTYGHGSRHVDAGTFDLLPGPKTYRKY